MTIAVVDWCQKCPGFPLPPAPRGRCRPWCGPATADRDARPACLSRAGKAPGALATNWAGNLHHAFGCADAAVCFRKELGPGCSGGTQVGLPTCRQYTRCHEALTCTFALALATKPAWSP